MWRVSEKKSEHFAAKQAATRSPRIVGIFLLRVPYYSPIAQQNQRILASVLVDFLCAYRVILVIVRARRGNIIVCRHLEPRAESFVWRIDWKVATSADDGRLQRSRVLTQQQHYTSIRLVGIVPFPRLATLHANLHTRISALWIAHRFCWLRAWQRSPSSSFSSSSVRMCDYQKSMALRKSNERI